MHNRSSAPSSSPRGPGPPSLWTIAAQGFVALLVVLVGAFSGNAVLLVAGLVAYLLAAFCLVVTVLGRRSVTAGPPPQPGPLRPSPGSAGPRGRS